jgi:hypothetical protein
VDGAVILAFAQVDVAAIVEDSGAAGRKLDRLVVVPDGEILVAPLGEIGVEIPLRLVLIGDRPAEPGGGMLRIEADRPVVVRNGAVGRP